MRLFFAVELPENVREAAWAISQDIRKNNPDFKATWVRPENMHLTLIFLKDAIAGSVRSARACAKKVTGLAPFEIELGESGVFPAKGAPRVLWIGLKKGGEELTRLQKELAQQCRKAKVSYDEKDFHPHLTIARIKSFTRPKLQPISLEPFTASKFTLIESKLTTTGPEYWVESEFPFSPHEG